ncbi:Calcium-independent receptor for alpha-latrotoxin [Carabus blaptoides fortunei]
MFITLVVLFLFSSSAYAETTGACEGSNLNITCPDNENIRISDANYGRSSLDICPTNVANQTANCTDENVTIILARRCNNQQNCTIPVNSTLLGDGCPGDSNYLSVDYTCFNESKPPFFCGINEHHALCGSNCEETCTDSSPQFCDDRCIVDKCVCNDGYVRDSPTNICILQNYCPLPGNDTHEIFASCGANCEATCKHRRPGFMCSLLSPCQPGYICEQGYVRDENTGQCVLPSKCPRVHRRFWPWTD